MPKSVQPFEYWWNQPVYNDLFNDALCWFPYFTQLYGSSAMCAYIRYCWQVKCKCFSFTLPWNLMFSRVSKRRNILYSMHTVCSKLQWNVSFMQMYLSCRNLFDSNYVLTRNLHTKVRRMHSHLSVKVDHN